MAEDPNVEWEIAPLSGRRRKVRKFRRVPLTGVAIRQGNPNHTSEAMGFMDLAKRLVSWYHKSSVENPQTAKLLTISKATGISRCTLRGYLITQKQYPNLLYMDKIARCLGVTVRDLMHESELTPPSQMAPQAKASRLERKVQSIQNTLDKMTAAIQSSVLEPDKTRMNVLVALILEELDNICVMYKIERTVLASTLSPENRAKNHLQPGEDGVTLDPGVSRTEETA